MQVSEGIVRIARKYDMPGIAGIQLRKLAYKVERLENIERRVREMDPMLYDYSDIIPICVFCQGYNHKDDCLWKQVQ